MLIRSITVILIVASLLVPQQKVLENQFKWTYLLETGDAIIITKALKWLDAPKEALAIQILSKPVDKNIIYCKGRILFPRYMSGEFVEADFDLEIKGENQVLIVQISLFLAQLIRMQNNILIIYPFLRLYI